MFKTLVSAIALSTTSIFAYTPADDVVRSGYIKKNNLKESDIPTALDRQSESQKKKLLDYKE